MLPPRARPGRTVKVRESVPAGVSTLKAPVREESGMVKLMRRWLEDWFTVGLETVKPSHRRRVSDGFSETF